MCLQVLLCLFQALLWHSLEQNLAILQQEQVFNSFTSSAYFRHSKHRWDFRIGGSGSSISSMFKDLMFLTAAAKLAGIAAAIFAISREDDRKIQTTQASTRFLPCFCQSFFVFANWTEKCRISMLSRQYFDLNFAGRPTLLNGRNWLFVCATLELEHKELRHISKRKYHD